MSVNFNLIMAEIGTRINVATFVTVSRTLLETAGSAKIGHRDSCLSLRIGIFLNLGMGSKIKILLNIK